MMTETSEQVTFADPDGEGEWRGDAGAIAELKEHFAREGRRDANSIKARFNSGRLTNREALKELARTFPILADLAMFQPGAHFDGDVMDAYRGDLCHGALCSLRFVGSVWNPTAKRKCGKFDLHDAMSCWDREHREAFVAWASDPWWP